MGHVLESARGALTLRGIMSLKSVRTNTHRARCGWREKIARTIPAKNYPPAQAAGASCDIAEQVLDNNCLEVIPKRFGCNKQGGVAQVLPTWANVGTISYEIGRMRSGICPISARTSARLLVWRGAIWQVLFGQFFGPHAVQQFRSSRPAACAVGGGGGGAIWQVLFAVFFRATRRSTVLQLAPGCMCGWGQVCICSGICLGHPPRARRVCVRHVCDSGIGQVSPPREFTGMDAGHARGLGHHRMSWLRADVSTNCNTNRGTLNGRMRVAK